jgi:hypothetical protein
VTGHSWGEVVAEVALCADSASDGIVFVCADFADGLRRFACTGGYHVGTGKWIRCNCRCHQVTGLVGITQASGRPPWERPPWERAWEARS